MGLLESLGPGLWRGMTWGHPIFLVSGANLPVEPDSLPLHILGTGQKGEKRPVVEMLAHRPALWQRYSAWLATLHPELWEEIRIMGKAQGGKFGFHLAPVIEEVGLKEVIHEVGLKRVIEEVGLPELLSKMTPAQRRELRRLLEGESQKRRGNQG
jgi:hypothetical protein